MRYQPPSSQAAEQNLPWYRQFWPWFIIALPAAAVIGSFVSLWLAVSHPDYLVVSEDRYQQINEGLKAQATEKEKQDPQQDPAGPRSR